MTHNKHKTGTDRIYEALNKLERPDIELVLNVQGDEPFTDIDDIRNLHNQMLNQK